MAFRDDVRYIEEMNPGRVRVVADECARTTGILLAGLSTLDGLAGRVDWQSDAAVLYERRLTESIGLAEGLHDGFDKAGRAVEDYAAAQARARERVNDGIAAESRLGALIAPIAATQTARVRSSAPLEQWNDLSGTTGVTDWLIEFREQGDIDAIRAEADQLSWQASSAYDDAILIESRARTTAIDQLAAARGLLPDFLANSPLSAKIVQGTPELADSGGKYHIGSPTRPDFAYDNDFPYDPNARVTAQDYVDWHKWMAKLNGGRLIRDDLDDATAAYAHYMNASGTDLRVDYEEAYREDPAIRLTVDNEIATAQREAERLYRETGQTAFEMTGNPSKAADYPDTENWQKTLGDHNVYGTSQTVVEGDRITMKITVYAEDMYNFNAHATDIATGAPDDANGRFSTLGWAQEFRTYGEVERTVTWTMGEAPVVTQDGGPGRQLPEDRGDGRSDG